MNKFEENLYVIGKNLDLAYYYGKVLLSEIFPHTSSYILDKYEQEYGLKSEGGTTQRRQRVLSAIRKKGGLSKAYLESVGNTLGEGRYTISIAPGSGEPPFVVHTNSPPGTKIPAAIRSVPVSDSIFFLDITVTGGNNPETELESMMEEIKPAWTVLHFVYL
jgi:uncharacterized protein YmfQ (DUF2313 family)